MSAESGLKMYLGNKYTINALASKSNDDEVFQQSVDYERENSYKHPLVLGTLLWLTTGVVTPHNDSTRTSESNQIFVDHLLPQGLSSAIKS